MKKVFALILALAMILTASSFALAEDLPTITIMFHGSNVTDDTAVLEAVNEYIADKVGAKLEVVWGTWGDFDEKATNALLSGDTGIDMVFTCSWSADEYNTYAKNGYFVKLDDLIAEYGADREPDAGRHHRGRRGHGHLRRERLQGYRHPELLGRERDPLERAGLHPGRLQGHELL